MPRLTPIQHGQIISCEIDVITGKPTGGATLTYIERLVATPASFEQSRRDARAAGIRAARKVNKKFDETFINAMLKTHSNSASS